MSSMEKLITRAYNSFTIDETRGVITKISSTQRLEDEIGYYTNLEASHPDQSVYLPRILKSSQLGETERWMELELYDYPNLGMCLLGQYQMNSWATLFTQLNNVLISWSHTYPKSVWSQDEIRNAAYEMYITKTEREQLAFCEGWKDKLDNLFREQLQDDTIIVNNTTYTVFETIWPQVKKYIEETMLDFTPTMIHGDCCFSNILYGGSKGILRFIDPRGSFGKQGIYGDIRYDVAKLYHSVDGTYEAFINDEFEVSSSGNNHQLTIQGHLTRIEIIHALEAFEKVFFPQYNQKQIKIIQGCIFIGMCARHYDSLTRQHAMYLTGIRLLNEALSL